ncbi:MAG: hypothetical protein NPIRA05_20910 [Nitrospirales bacterium]|nr:MAG: hypothetical protein NPIRA05_20910 [Nitrospirales bacterium]
MNYRVPSLLLALLFLVIMTIGSLQPKTVFACAMMDMIVLDDCCCGNHKIDQDCVESSCDAMQEFSTEPCCERSVEISINEEAKHSQPIAKPMEVRSDVDPPQAIANSFDILAPPQYVVAFEVLHSQPIASLSGSNTYLITQRLRI